MSQPIDAAQALAWVSRGFLGMPESMREPDADRRLVLAQQVAVCFQQHPEVLQLILDLTINRPPVNFQLHGQAYLDYAVQRHGQNTVAAALLDYLNVGLSKGTYDATAPISEFGPARSGAGRRDSYDASHGIDFTGPAGYLG